MLPFLQHNAEEIAGGRAFLLDKLPNMKECAELSAKGKVYVSQNTIQHVISPKQTVTYIKRTKAAEILAARETVSALTGEELSLLPFTFPALARFLSRWLNVQDKGAHIGKTLLPAYHFQMCTPCSFDEEMTLFDMKAAYWQVAIRAKSLLCDVNPKTGKIYWLVMSNQTEQKWERMKTALLPHKALRLAVIGVNAVNWAGDNKGTSYFHAGNLIQSAGTPPVAFHNLACLTIRVAYELTQMQARESPGLYANADSILTDRPVKYWDDLGIDYSIKAQGKVNVCSLGVYRVGSEETKPFRHISERELYSYHEPLWLENPSLHLQFFN